MSTLTSIASIPNAVESAGRGISQGIETLDGEAAQIARSALISSSNNSDSASASASNSASNSSLADAFVGSLQAKLSVEASAQVLSSADQVLGTLIDVTA